MRLVGGSIVLHAPCWLHNIAANGGDFLSSVESTIIAVKIPTQGFPKNADNTDTDNEISGDSVGQEYGLLSIFASARNRC